MPVVTGSYLAAYLAATLLWRNTMEPLINGHFGDKEFCPLQGGVRYWECPLLEVPL